MQPEFAAGSRSQPVALGGGEAAGEEQERDHHNHGDGEKDKKQSGEIPHFVHSLVPREGGAKTPARSPAPELALLDPQPACELDRRRCLAMKP